MDMESVSEQAELESRVAIIYDPLMGLPHVSPLQAIECHVENPTRLFAIVNKLEELCVLDDCVRLDAREATDEEILRAHSKEHMNRVDGIAHMCPQQRLKESLNGYDQFVASGTSLAARLAAGCVTEAVLQVLAGKVDFAFAAVRPPGHHAMADSAIMKVEDELQCPRALGFCYYNNTVIAALAALSAGAKRVAILDWDVHHGDGIQLLTQGRSDILYISLHRYGLDNKGAEFFPGTGHSSEVGQGEGLGFNVNIPFNGPGFGDADYMAAVELIACPILEEYAADVLIIAAGFDAARGDPLGGMNVTPAGYAAVLERVQHSCSKNPWHRGAVMALEGGYNPNVSASCAAACVKIAMVEDTHRSGTNPHCGKNCKRETPEILAEVAEFHRHHWSAMRKKSFVASLTSFNFSFSSKRHQQAPVAPPAVPEATKCQKQGHRHQCRATPAPRRWILHPDYSAWEPVWW